MSFSITHKKAAALIVLTGALTFANTLFSGFIGDEEVFILDNTFYTSWSNAPSLFSEDYFPTGAKNRTIEGHYFSGSVAYRPVLSLTYFIDYWLWQLKPFGYHLSNVIFHIANTLLVYCLLFKLSRSRGAALTAALFFCVHPIQSEAVSNIGYRADLLSTFFVLSSFLCFLKHDEGQGRPAFYFPVSVLLYFLALFTKESSIVLI